jgi:hypothetical protein
MMLEQICLTFELYHAEINVYLIVAYKGIIAAKVFLSAIDAVKFNFPIIPTAMP